jgi:hypothetical protein
VKADQRPTVLVVQDNRILISLSAFCLSNTAIMSAACVLQTTRSRDNASHAFQVTRLLFNFGEVGFCSRAESAPNPKIDIVCDAVYGTIHQANVDHASMPTAGR